MFTWEQLPIMLLLEILGSKSLEVRSIRKMIQVANEHLKREEIHLRRDVKLESNIKLGS